MFDYIEREIQATRREETRREKAMDRMLAKGLENRSASWQNINYGAAKVAYCSMDTIIETMNYTLIGDRYE
jgi:hypothetical protein